MHWSKEDSCKWFACQSCMPFDPFHMIQNEKYHQHDWRTWKETARTTKYKVLKSERDPKKKRTKSGFNLSLGAK